jgi:thiamine kinase-like enzyme
MKKAALLISVFILGFSLFVGYYLTSWKKGLPSEDFIIEKNFTKENMLKLVSFHIGAWEKLKPENIEFTHLTAGKSNIVFKVSIIGVENTESEKELLKIISPDVVILRVFGKTVKKIVNEEKERIVFRELSKSGLGNKLLGEGATYRIEEFIKGKNVVRSELKHKDAVYHFAIAICDFHFGTEGVKHALNTLGIKRRFVKYYLYDWIDIFKEEYQSYFNYVKKPDNIRILKRMEHYLQEDYLREFKKDLPPKTEAVVSHNDLNNRNFLIKDNGKVVLIDFEYTAFNYRGYVIHFNICDVYFF